MVHSFGHYLGLRTGHGRGPQTSGSNRDIDLRVQGTSEMSVRGRRHLPKGLDTADGDATAEQPPEKRLRTDKPEKVEPLGAREEEIVRWTHAAPLGVHACFSTGPETILRRLAMQPTQELKVVLRECARHRKDADRDVKVITWMEGFVIAILAKFHKANQPL